MPGLKPRREEGREGGRGLARQSCLTRYGGIVKQEGRELAAVREGVSRVCGRRAGKRMRKWGDVRGTAHGSLAKYLSGFVR